MGLREEPPKNRQWLHQFRMSHQHTVKYFSSFDVDITFSVGWFSEQSQTITSSASVVTLVFCGIHTIFRFSYILL